MAILTMPVTGRNGAIVVVLGCGVRLTTNSLVGSLNRSGGDSSDPFMTIVTDS